MGQRLSRRFRNQPDTTSSISNASKSVSLPEGFKYIDDRLFSTKGNPAYALPNDDIEFSRLNEQHYQYRFVMQGNQKAPVHDKLRKGIKVLDAGCGTGIWSLEMAREYPKSNFVGTDLLDLFESTISHAPPNVRFLIANTLSLPFEDNTFDYVFQRLQTICFRENEWPIVIKELVRVTKPGGWVELVDGDGWLQNPGPQALKFLNLMQQMMTMRGVNTKFVLTLPELLREKGLEEVEYKQCSIPIGWGPPEIALPAAQNIVTGIESMKAQMTISLGMSDEEYHAMAEEISTEFVKNKTFSNVEIMYGRKPLGTVAK